MTDVRTLKDEAAAAMGRSQWKAALKAYSDLARLQPREGTWPLRAGDAARRLGAHREAIGWYERAAATYGEHGFTVRAIAVGKMVEALDPGNDRILRTLDRAESRPALRLPPPIPPLEPPVPVGTAAATMTTAALEGPPLGGKLNGPPLTPRHDESTMTSMEIVFEDADDGIPIEEASILLQDGSRPTGDRAEPREGVLESLPTFPLFEILPPGAFLSLVSQLEARSLSAGQLVVRQGEPGTSLFAIVDGTAIVYAEGRRNTPLATLEAGEVFGEMALVLDQPRAATVEAATDLEVFEMDRQILRAVLDEHPQLGEVLGRMIKRRLVENVMRTAPLFAAVEPSARRDLMLRFEVREVPAGTRLVAEGTAADALYVVLAGLVEAEVGQGDATRTVAELGPGQVIGAAALVDARHASRTSFRASRGTVALRLPRSAFNEVVCIYPTVLEHLSLVADEQASWAEGAAISVV